ncbi:MAG: hypothetical protein CXT78_01325 [Thaumarchaeota archaeon]|jgi:hypothetical protein|nr:MAG: hypothetical protein CXT78_01325 [Nitrososphaerota archaeon]
MPESKSPFFRAWYYFRNGWSLYFAFIFAAINTLVVTYYLAIDKIPFLLDFFPSFGHYVAVTIFLGVPILVIIGFVHFKRSPAYRSEATIGFEVNPYMRRNLINSEINLELNLMILNLLSKLSNNEKLNEDELNKIQESRNILNNFIDKRSIKNDKDLEYLKKLIDK